jgi:flagellar P-ring protein precursor FlgI
MLQWQSNQGGGAAFRLAAYALGVLCWAACAPPLSAGTETGVRLKSLVSIEGVRGNQLVGYGLVVGLNGTGDKQQTLFPVQSLINMLERMGVNMSSLPSGSITVKNTAAVIVTATLPPFGQAGTLVDATVGAVGDASNLQGGLLVLTTLRGVNGQVYATVQGTVITAGFVAGRSANSTSVNHPTAGRIPNGVTIERPAPSVAIGSVIKLQLNEADFETSVRISAAVNEHFHSVNPVAHAENSALVSISLPEDYKARPIEFVAEVESLLVEPDRVARVVINERTGTVVLGAEVHISPVAIIHGNLTVAIRTRPLVVPGGLLGASTTVPETTVAARDDKSRNLVLKEGATVEELVRALASIGSTTRDVVAILESLKAAGALEAELEVI